MGSSARRTVLHVTDKRSKERVRHGKKVLKHYGHLGYDVEEITYKDSQVKEIDLIAEYKAAPGTDKFSMEKGDMQEWK